MPRLLCSLFALKAKCIVFCQWDSLLGNIACAFKDFGVRYSRLRGSVYAQTRTLVNFQGDAAIWFDCCLYSQDV